MPSQVLTSVENNFTKGLITESTGLNFPENAATDTDNCEYTLIGDVLRREGIDFEINGITSSINRSGLAMSTYVWNNVGGDGSTQLFCAQTGGTVHFWSITDSTTASPLSNHLLVSGVDLSIFVATGGTFDTTLECQFADGNGYLFIFHPNCDPIYVTYNAGTLTGNAISIQVRDFVGIPEAVADNIRQQTINNYHNYNLTNQGWISTNLWYFTSATANTISIGSHSFQVQAGITGVVAGQTCTISENNGKGTMTGPVTSYGGTTLVVNVTSFTGSGGISFTNWTIQPSNAGYTAAFFTLTGSYPSNADQWWSFKNTSGVFDPATTQNNTSIGSGPAPKGHIVFSPFQQYRTAASGVGQLTDIVTTARPTNGCWFQGRVWYTGVNASVQANVEEPYTTWTENIYFSKIVETISDFPKCYQQNDPTSELLFDLLPSDGGVIVIQGTGPIYRLFPIQNGLLVFAANGIWFITGSQGIGFTANDYTITKISSVKSISSNSFVNVQGLPYFWNEEGIYMVSPSKQGGLEVVSITVSTVLSFYSDIPLSSKKYVRGDYNPIEYLIQWTYRSTEAPDVTGRYTLDKILNYNTYNKAFFPYTVSTEFCNLCGVQYVSGPGGSTTPQSGFKYLSSFLSGSNVNALGFADEHDTTYVDWRSNGTPTDYLSYFITGYKLHGQAQRRFQMPYIYVYNRMISDTVAYYIQGLWDYASDRNSNRWSVPQYTTITETHRNNSFRRHRIRGQGLVLQIKVYSVSGQPFDVMGWSVFEQQNTGV